MLKFHKITSETQAVLAPFFEREGVRLCDYSFGVKFMWKDVWDSRYALTGDSLVVKENYEDASHAFFYPLGGDADAALREIEEYAAAHGFPLEFLCVPDEKLPLLLERYGAAASVERHRDWMDYLYLADDLKFFPGKKFQSQRNHLNKFVRTYGAPSFFRATEADLPEIGAFFDEYMKESGIEGGFAEVEAEHARAMLSSALGLGFPFGYVRADGKIVAFSIGERVGDTLMIHIEKALYSVPGAYQAIVSEFAKAFAEGGVKYINREDDAGDEGLRISKTRYNPVAMLGKNFVRVDDLARRVKFLPDLESDRLTYGAVREDELPRYRDLNLDDENNRYWGYDYRADLHGRAPTAEYFGNMLKDDFDRRETFCFAAREKATGALVGEGVLYEFRGDFGCEIGARIFPAFRGRGYGREIFAKMAEYAASVGFETVRAKRYRENAPAEKMILAAGFRKVGEDGTFDFYERAGKRRPKRK